MSRETPTMNGSAGGVTKQDTALDALNLQLKQNKKYTKFHGDALIGDVRRDNSLLARWRNSREDLRRIFLNPANYPALGRVLGKFITTQSLDMRSGAGLIAALANDSNRREAFIESQVKDKFERMLHPPLTYLGEAFQYRTADGKFNSAMNPHLGQAGAPYAKTVPSITHPLGALPDAGDIFDRLMAREEGGRNSGSGLSSMLIYHATIIIHDIFRTNDNDKNISDSSSYLDLSPLYGYTMEMQKKVRDDKFKLGLLKPDTFAEDRLLRQPPGVCIMLVMYNRYHNYAATQLRRINENGRFTVPAKFRGPKLAQVAKHFVEKETLKDKAFIDACKKYQEAWDKYMTDSSDAQVEKAADALETLIEYSRVDPDARKKFEDEYDGNKGNEPRLRIVAVAKKFVTGKDDVLKQLCTSYEQALSRSDTEGKDIKRKHEQASATLQVFIDEAKQHPTEEAQQKFKDAYDAAWDKLDEDLFNTARLITCGIYINISIHDYLRALMGFHQWDTNFTLEPRVAMNHRNVSRGLGNQVTVEFNLLYRFHCAISQADEKYTEEFMKEVAGDPRYDPKTMSLSDFLKMMAESTKYKQNAKREVKPWEVEFGLKKNPELAFKRNPITGLFDDNQMITQLVKSMDDPISNFGPLNIPRCLRSVEIMGILQARQWQVGTLNDFRDFFGMKRHDTFESITGDVGVQDALRDLYEHPDKVELYPGVFCESDANRNLDPGPSDVSSALWAAIFSDAITLVRSDRFYTVDWNTNSLTSWGMKEVSPDNDVLKTSVFHRLLQRSFPEWFPYDSVRFFHPFYTSTTNAEYARKQGYAPGFAMKSIPVEKNMMGEPTKYRYDVSASTPHKPSKPVLLDEYDKIAALLADDADVFIHPAQKELQGLPRGIVEVLSARGKKPAPKPKDPEIKEDTEAVKAYFTTLMRDIVKRESVLMNAQKGVYQLDITRDFAIPVTTRYVADFLGFGHLIKGDTNSKAPYTENQIYQHITNCQTFFAYNADETKLIKRRQAFKASMTFLYELARNGNIYQANRWSITQFFMSMGKKEGNHLSKLGFKVAKRILAHERNADRAAAVLLMIALDSAFNSVLAFTSVLDFLLKGLYKLADKEDPMNRADWLVIQKFALEEGEQSDIIINGTVLAAQGQSVRLPIVRKALKDKDVKDASGKTLFSVKKGDTIVCDINVAMQKDPESFRKGGYLTYQPSFTTKYAEFHPEHVAILGLTSMIKFVAQMKNLRRGHDSQGRLKKIRLDASNEGYSNYMAPMRMRMIEADAEWARKHGRTNEAVKVITKGVLKPSTDTYMTPEWDEFIPFPSTWKVRFDGFGRSDYGGADFPMLQQTIAGLPDDFPPFYQAQGSSKYGGTFAFCICETPGVPCGCKAAASSRASSESYVMAAHPEAHHAPAVSVGCGVPGEHLAGGVD